MAAFKKDYQKKYNKKKNFNKQAFLAKLEEYLDNEEDTDKDSNPDIESNERVQEIEDSEDEEDNESIEFEDVVRKSLKNKTNKIKANYKIAYLATKKPIKTGIVALLAKSARIKEQEIEIVVDTGSTIFSVCQRKFLSNYQPVNTQIHWGNAGKLKVKGQGDLIIQFQNGSSLTLKNVYYILEFGINLLSISKLDNIEATFSKDKVIIRDENKKEIVQGYSKRDLYHI